MRDKITQVDTKILQLIAERTAIARRIGALKGMNRLGIRDPDVESKILARAEADAKKLDLPEDMIRKLFELLIEASVNEQRKVTTELQERDVAGRCVIYGGAGGMGRLLSELMMLYGYEITVVRSSGAVLHYPEMTEEKSSISSADFSIVSVPMRSTAQIIERSAAEVSGKRIYEICSMKNHLREAISRVRRKGMEVVSLHPMFGPGIRSFINQPVIFCSDGEKDFRDDPLWNAFSSEGARLFTIPFDSHDRLMSYILQFTHLMNIIYFTVLSNSGLDLKEFERAASPIFERQLTNANAVAQQDPELYFEIQRLSGHLENLLREFERARNEVIEALNDASGEKFKELMKRGNQYFKGG